MANKMTKKELVKRFKHPKLAWEDLLLWISQQNDPVCAYDIEDKFGLKKGESNARLHKLKDRRYVKEAPDYIYGNSIDERIQSIIDRRKVKRGRYCKFYVITERGLSRIK